MRVLVTGGAGYIGAHACKALARAGHHPVAYDNLATGHRWAVRWGPLEHGEVTDPVRLAEAMRAHRIDTVMHFAALSTVGESVARPDRYWRVNVGGTLALLTAMRAAGVGRIIFSSTCAVYGVPEALPITEATGRAPVNPYGDTKLAAETMLAHQAAAEGIGAIALRYFNAAGADPDGELGEEHDPETHAIPLILQAAAGLRERFTIYGTDYDTRDGSCVRDYVHVSDLASAHVLALEAVGEGRLAAYNLGSGAGFTVNEVVGVARQVTGRPIAAEAGARRPGDPAVLTADAAAARSALGWQPAHSDLGTMIETAWRWMTDRRAHVGLAPLSRAP